MKMRNWLCVFMVLCLAGLSSAKSSFKDNFDGVTLRGLSDGEVVQAEIGWAGKIDDDAEAMRAINGKTVEYGVLGRWHEDDPKNLNGLGAYVFLMVDPNITIPLKEFLPFVGTWLKLPETLTGEASIGVSVMVVNFHETMDAVLAPMIQATIGPICIRGTYEWVESNGQEKGAMSSEGRIMLGGCFRF
jgi:hypothetical protein